MNITTHKRLKVMMITEGTYPYHWGGVSTWCHLLLNDLPNIDFTLVSLVGDPAAGLQFKLPASVAEFRPIPLWGIREVRETLPSLSFRELQLRNQRTSDDLIAREFVPNFWAFLEELFAKSGQPHHLATLIHNMHRFFLKYDFDKTMRAPVVWECFVEVAQERFPQAARQHGYPDERFTLADLTTCFHWLYHWLFPLASPLPKVDVAHAAMAGICTMVAVATKFEHGAAFMLTEHGIYLRERYLAEATTSVSLFRKVFSLRFARRMTELSYALADYIAPCCDFNQRWELRNGAKPDQVKTIYYGVDSVVFKPEPKPAGDPPVVVWVGRIDPLKDLVTLLKAAAIIRETRPDIEFRLFGTAPPGNESYFEKCLDLRRELGLEQTVIFAGYRANPAGAFNEGDVAVLSSVSEAFPFVILEAMLCEKPVVATAVGGVPEQLKGCGIAVEPRNPDAMAEAILSLINNPELSKSLGTAARQKAMVEYSVRQSAQAHEAVYRKLANHMPGIIPMPVRTSRHRRRRALPFLRPGINNPSTASTASAWGAGPALVRSARTVSAESIYSAPATSRLTYPQQPVQDRPRPETPAQAHPDTTEHVGREIVPAAHDAGIAWRTHYAGAIELLAAEVAQRDVQPIDDLEVTAILESVGITDGVALQRYGAPDVFALGNAVLETLRLHGLTLRQINAPVIPKVSRTDATKDYLKGPLGLVPPILLLLTIAAFGYWGGWTQRQIMMLSTGMTCSLVLTNGLIQAISRRTSLYLGMAKPRMASRYLILSASTMTAIALAFIAFAAYLLERNGFFSSDDLTIFFISFAGLTVVWMAAGGLSLLQQPVWLSIAIGTGLLCGISANWLAMHLTHFHLAIGAFLGYACALAVICMALYRGFKHLEARPTSSRAVTRLPPLAYMVDEAAPYFTYGFMYMILIFLPHVYGWLGYIPDGQARAAAATNIEIGLTLSMPPLILAYGVAEHSLRLFWRRVVVIQALTPANKVECFGQVLLSFVARRRWIYIAVLTAITLIAHEVFHRALVEGWLGHWLQPADPEQLRFIFDASLIAYGFLGLGLFNCMFVVTLGRPQAANRAVIWGCFVMVATGSMLCPFNFAFAAIAFAIAAFVFAAISWAEADDVIRGADHSFASVLS